MVFRIEKSVSERRRRDHPAMAIENVSCGAIAALWIRHDRRWRKQAITLTTTEFGSPAQVDE
jgi:hypothetical protein